MTDQRQHRGPHPEDTALFGPEKHKVLRLAVSDCCWLFTRGYSPESALKLVGDHFALTKRQRSAVARASCSEQAKEKRLGKILPKEKMLGQELCLDGFNVLTTIEAALSSGLILDCHDGTFKDLASMHGSWRKVKETFLAIEAILSQIIELKVQNCVWYLDRPVSNSRRLGAMILEIAEAIQIPTSVRLSDNTDKELMNSHSVIATADSQILNCCNQWYNLAREVVEKSVPNAWILQLS